MELIKISSMPLEKFFHVVHVFIQSAIKIKCQIYVGTHNPNVEIIRVTVEVVREQKK